MSDYNSQDEPVECPLCCLPLEVDDLNFFPCSCGYQICRFCWHRIRTDENQLCPACRSPYSENPADFKPLSKEQVVALKAEKRQRDQQKKQKVNEDRKHLANVRVVQKNLVFVVGLPPRLADPEVLKRHEYFGKYGKIHKVVINPSTTYAGAQGPSASAYVTYVNNSDALRAIQSVNNILIDGRLIKTSLGTTKYCSNFMKNQPCPKPDCMYLHELGDEEASFTKEEMHQGKHQEYEKKLHDSLIAQQNLEETKTGTEVRKKGNGGQNSKRHGGKETWPSLTSSPTPKAAQKPTKDLQKSESKTGKSEKGKSDKYRAEDSSESKESSEESNGKEEEGTTPYGWTKVEEEEPKSEEEIVADSFSQLKMQSDRSKDSLEEQAEDQSQEVNIEGNVEPKKVKGRQSFNALSHLPDLLNGTEIDPINYTNYAHPDQQFNENVSDWGDNLNKVLNDHMKFVPKMSENIALMNSLPENSMDKLDQFNDVKNNCSSNMLKFFDFHKNKQNQNYQKISYPAVEKQQTFPEHKTDSETSNRMINFSNVDSFSNTNVINRSAMPSNGYPVQNQQTVADELGFDPFTETQKALEELIKDEVKKKNTMDANSKRNALNAPPGFSQINLSPVQRSVAKQNTWNGFNQPPQNPNMMNIHKPNGVGYSNNGDWTTLDPAIVSYRQFPAYNYGSAFEPTDFHPNLPGLGGNSHMNDFHFNPPPPQNIGLGFAFDGNPSYGLFNRNAGVNANANWCNQNTGFQNSSNLEKLLVNLPPGFHHNTNRNN